MRYIGSTDLPAEKDDFEIGSYKDSMANFIESCNTPMTISIQGTWGTGKTSFMKMVSSNLSKCKFIEFNTWQFSQFDMDNSLSLSLIKSLIDDMGLKEEQKKGMATAMSGAKIGKFFGSVGAVAVEKFFGIGNLGGVAGEVIEKIGKAFAEDDSNPVNAVKEIKKEFEKCVSECKKANDVDRVVIFIDDLDRLEPRKAVELLEVLKNFLDCKDCVFVLAIDYDVVQKEVAAKYGHADGSGSLDRKKGKDFFDKIIQVPFKMPVAQYNIDNYLEKCLSGIQNKKRPVFSAGEDFSIYIRLVKASIGTNPRSIKRLVNSFQLLVMVVDMHESLRIEDCKLVIFATLCLQELDTAVYDAIVRGREELTWEKLEAFKDSNVPLIREFFPSIKLDEDDDDGTDLSAVASFMAEFVPIIGALSEEPSDNDRLKKFKEILNFSYVTAADSDSAPTRKREKARISNDISDAELRINNREDLEHIVNIARQCLGAGEGNPVRVTVRNRKYETLTELAFEDYRGSVEIYETKGGFAVELYAKNDFYDSFLTDGLKDIIYVKNSAKKLHEASGAGLKYFRLPAEIGNEEQEEDIKAVLCRFRDFYEMSK